VAPKGHQGRSLAKYLQREVRAYSAFYRPALERAFRERAGRSGVDLDALPLTSLEEIGDPTHLVLRPEYATISRYGAPALGAKVLWSRVTGRMPRLNRTVIDPVYKPIHWTSDGGLLLGWSLADLDRLAELGRRWLEMAGARRSDVLVSVVAPGPRLSFWELTLGARHAGLTSIFLPADAPAADVVGLRPTVLAGRSDDILRILTDGGDDQGVAGIRTVLIVGEVPDEDVRASVAAMLVDPATPVLFAWAPDGGRSLWGECPGRTGLHTWPDAEVVEIVDGAVVWTALNWYGSVLVRLRTEVAGAIDRGPCPGCGRTTPRMRLGAAAAAPARPPAPARPRRDRAPEPAARPRRERARPAPPVDPTRPVEEPEEVAAAEEEAVEVEAQARVPTFADTLASHVGVADWQAELRMVEGAEELLVFLTPGNGDLASVLQDLVRAMSVTQFVVLPPDVLAARRDEYGGERIVDLRP
jgi:hypothetical protein